MKKTRYIPVQERIWDTEYSLEYKIDKATSAEYAVLKSPYTKWVSDSNMTLAFKSDTVRDPEIISCIEREFFDKERFQIPVADYGLATLDAVASRQLPEKVLRAIVDGTYKLPDGMD